MITGSKWRASSLARSTSSAPFDWVADITMIDSASGTHQAIATIRQSGARPFVEVRMLVAAMARAPAMLDLLAGIAGVIDMSDPEHATFADSAADCLDALLAHEGALRALLSEFYTSGR